MPPEEWLARIKKLEATRPQEVVICAACLVWWDYFGNQTWPHLNEYRHAWRVSMSPPNEDVRDALIEIGFPPDLAANRVMGDRDLEKGRERRKRKRLAELATVESGFDSDVV